MKKKKTPINGAENKLFLLNGKIPRMRFCSLQGL